MRKNTDFQMYLPILVFSLQYQQKFSLIFFLIVGKYHHSCQTVFALALFGNNKYFEPFIGQTFSVSTNGLGKHEIKIEKLNGAFSNLIIIDGINQNGIKIKTIIDLITFTKELEFSDGRKTKYFSFK